MTDKVQSISDMQRQIDKLNARVKQLEFNLIVVAVILLGIAYYLFR